MDDDFETFALPARPLRKIDWAVFGLGVLKDFLDVAAEVAGVAQEMVGRHSNHLLERAQFHEDAAVELESLMRGEGDES